MFVYNRLNLKFCQKSLKYIICMLAIYNFKILKKSHSDNCIGTTLNELC